GEVRWPVEPIAREGVAGSELGLHGTHLFRRDIDQVDLRLEWCIEGRQETNVPKTQGKRGGRQGQQQCHRPAGAFGDHQDTPAGINWVKYIIKTMRWVIHCDPPRTRPQYNLNRPADQRLRDLHTVGGSTLAYVVGDNP